MNMLEETDVVISEPIQAGRFSPVVLSEAGSSPPRARKPSRFLRPRALGKFLFLEEEKFFVKGVTYGAFPPNFDGHQFPESAQVEQDFQLMREAGINAVLTYTLPPLALLDQAQAHGLRIIVNIPWLGHICFLESK